MSEQTPISEWAEGILRKAARGASSAETLDHHLRAQKCISAKVLGAILGCSVDTVHRRRRTQGLPAHYDGARWKFFGPEVAAWQANRDRQQGHAQKNGTNSRKSVTSTGGAK